jgi:hypothetical protein
VDSRDHFNRDGAPGKEREDSLQPFRVGLITRTDTEGSLVQCNYFNAQALVTKMSVKYRTNLQSEYR